MPHKLPNTLADNALATLPDKFPLRLSPVQGKPRILITCHRNADFDAFASLVGALALYPDAVLLYPGSQEKALHNFYEEALQYLYPFVPAKEIDFTSIELLVVVDTCQSSRIGHVQPLLDRYEALQSPEGTEEIMLPLSLHVWDHHPPAADDLTPTWACIEPLASTSTLLAQMAQRHAVELDCAFATMLGLGIYGDTGSFSYTSTSSAEFLACAWLHTKGMDVTLIAQLLKQSITKEQIAALNQLLENFTLHEMGGLRMVIASAHMDEFLNDFAMIASRFMEIQPCQVFFGICSMENAVHIVARSLADQIDVASVCAELGGGGHSYAASAVVRDQTLPQIKDLILSRMTMQINRMVNAGTLMSSPVVPVYENQTLRQAETIMGRYGFKALPVFLPGTHRCSGIVELSITQRALSHGLGSYPVSAYMQRSFQVVTPQTDLQTIMDIIMGNRQRLVPVISGESPGVLSLTGSEALSKEHEVTGVLTRTDLIRMFTAEGSLPKPRTSGKREKNVARAMTALIPPACIHILKEIGKLGSELNIPVYVVGGFVRDLLLEQKGKHWPDLDIDLVVEGDAAFFARKLAEKFHGTMREHKKFLTALVLFSQENEAEHRQTQSSPHLALQLLKEQEKKNYNPQSHTMLRSHAQEKMARIDIATARLEYYEEPGALPTVELSSLKMDLYRRDFTINAMAIRLNEENFGILVDYFDGQNDIKQKRIRMLHALSFVEDPTRALRAVRFEQRYGFRIGQQAERLIRNALELGLIDKLSGARIVAELESMMEEKNPLPCFVRMQEFDMLAAIAPPFALNAAKQELLASMLDVLDWHSMLYLSEEPDKIQLLILVLCRGHNTQDFLDVLSRLALIHPMREQLLETRSSIIDVLPQLEKWHDREGLVSELADLLRNFPLEALLYLAARVEDEELKKKLTLYIYKWRFEKADISGEEILALGLPRGPQIGELLKMARAAKLDNIAPSHDAQWELVKEWAAPMLAAQAAQKAQ